MKKNLAKIFVSASTVVALILIAVLWAAMFGGIEKGDFNSLAKGMLIAISVLYMIIIAVTITIMFVEGENVKEVIIRMDQGGNVRVAASAFVKLIKDALKEIDGVKCKKIGLVSDGYGVRLKVSIKLVDKDVEETETYIRTLLEELFVEEFKYKFNSIDINIVHLVPNYKADEQKIKEQVKKILDEKHAEEEALADKEAKAAPESAHEEVSEEAPAEEVHEAPAEEVHEEAPVAEAHEAHAEDAPLFEEE